MEKFTMRGFFLPNLRIFRFNAGLTQGELAEQAGISLTTISNIETGKNRVSPNTAFKIADILKCGVNELAAVDIPIKRSDAAKETHGMTFSGKQRISKPGRNRPTQFKSKDGTVKVKKEVVNGNLPDVSELEEDFTKVYPTKTKTKGGDFD